MEPYRALTGNPIANHSKGTLIIIETYTTLKGTPETLNPKSKL